MMVPDVDPSLLRRWRLSDPLLIADTHSSHVWRARSNSGATVILKRLKPEGLAERSGFDFLRWRDGRGTVRLLDAQDDHALLEDAGAQTLACVFGADRDVEATGVIVSLLPELHSTMPRPAPQGLMPFAEHVKALFALEERGGDHREICGWAAAEARSLLAQTHDVRPLHGDLHHDNILFDGKDRWRAIDPHGLVGDPVYDVANVFGNPLGGVSLIVSPERIARLGRDFGVYFGCRPDRVLQFAAVHAILSVAWSLERPEAEGAQQNIKERLAFAWLVRTMLSDGL
jgi:streptomycin 6-kinase